MNSKNKTGSVNAFDFDLGLGSGRSKPMNNQKNQGSSYQSTPQQKPNTTSNWSHQPNKPAWSHQPAGSLPGPTSMVGDIFGKSWNSSSSSTSGVAGVGIVNSKNPNLFGDLLGSAIGNKSNSNVPLKNVGQNSFSMGNVANSLPKTGNSTTTNTASGGGNVNLGGNFGKSSSIGGGNVNLGGNNASLNLGGTWIKNMAGIGGGGGGGGGLGSNKDPFGSLVDFSSKPQGGMSSNSAKKANDATKFGNGNGNDSFGEFQKNASTTSGSTYSSATFPSTKANPNPMHDFGFSNSQSQYQPQASVQSAGASDFDAFFPSSSGVGTTGSEGLTSGNDDWGVGAEFGGGHETGGTTELEGLPPPPAGVTAPSAKSKGMDNYKQGQFADAIKWLSWALVLFEKKGDADGTTEVLSCRASCYKEVGEYKKAVADCTKVLVHDDKNVSVLVQRALLYESMEKYRLGADDLRTVMKLDPTNRLARSTIHRLNKMAE